MKPIRLGIIIGAKDTLSPVFKSATKKVAAFDARVKEVSGSLIEMGGAAKDGFRQLAVGTGVLTGVAVGLGAVNGEIAKMSNLSDTVGMDFNTINSMGNAVKGIGLNYESVIDTVEQLHNVMGEAKTAHEEWAKTDKLEGKEFKTISAVDDAFKGLDFSAVDSSFKGLSDEEIFKRVSGLDPKKQYELVMNTALKMEDHQIAASMVDILMGGESNKILSYMRVKNIDNIAELEAYGQKLTFLNEEGKKGALAYSSIFAETKTIIGSIFQQGAGMSGGFLTPVLNDMNNWLVTHKGLVQQNIKGFFVGVGEALGSMGDKLNQASKFFEPVVDFFSQGEEIENKGNLIGKTITYIGAGLFGLVGAKIAFGTLALGAGVLTAALSPIGLLIGGIALGGAFIAKHWEPVKSFFNGFIIGFKDGFTEVADSLEPIGSALKPIGDLFSSVFGSAIEFVKGLFQPLDNAESKMQSWGVTGQTVGRVIADAGGFIIKFWKPVKSFFSGIITGFQDGFTEVAGSLESIGTALQPVGDLFSWVFGSAIEFISGLFQPLDNASEKTESWGNAGQIFGKVIGSVFGGIAKVITTTVTIFTTAYTTIVSTWDSVSAWFTDLWNRVGTAFNVGMEFVKSVLSWSPLEMIQGLWDGAFNYLSSKFEWLSSKIDWVKSISFFGDDQEETQSTPPKKEEPSFWSGWFGDDNEEPKEQARNIKALALAPVVATSLVASDVKIPQTKKQTFETHEEFVGTQKPETQDKKFTTTEVFKPAIISESKDRSMITSEKFLPQKKPKVTNQEFTTVEKFKSALPESKLDSGSLYPKIERLEAPKHIQKGDINISMPTTIHVNSTDGKVDERELQRAVDAVMHKSARKIQMNTSHEDEEI